MLKETMDLGDTLRTYTMSDRELKKYIEFIYSECGITLSIAKKSMVCSRLSKRLRALNIRSFKDYFDFVSSSEGQKTELVFMIDAITTNTTEFFRENHHFNYLASHTLPSLLRSGHFENQRTLKIWSAGCSSGEEPYSIAMVLADYFERNEGDFSILATDICSKVLAKAEKAIYDKEAVENVPSHLKRKYLMKGTNSQAGMVRVVPELRSKITFKRLNFISDPFDVDPPLDIIFCRNVIIYFDQKTKANLIEKFHRCLGPWGYYFIGHSETLTGLSNKFESVSPTIYRKI